MKEKNILMLKKTVNISFTVLKVLGMTGALAAMLICPNIAQVFAPFVKNDGKPFYSPKRINYAIARLRNKGWIELIKKHGHGYYSLTESGKTALAKYELKQLTITKPKKWDNRWRIVIFDIREKRRFKRDAIRSLLMKFGFKLLQESVWIYPYKCSDVIELAKTAYGIRRDAIYLICDHFPNDEHLAFLFNLGLDPNQ